MKRYGLFFGILAVVLVLVGVRLVMTMNGPSDTQQIRDALAASIRASKEGKPGGVMDYLSSKLRINDTDELPASQVQNFIKNSRPDVTVGRVDPVVNSSEGTAHVLTSAKVSYDWLNQKGSIDLSEVDILFRREDAHEWLIFPTKKWRIVEIDIPQDKMPPGL